MADYDFTSATVGQTLQSIDSDWTQLSGSFIVDNTGLGSNNSAAAAIYGTGSTKHDQEITFSISGAAYLPYAVVSLHYTSGTGDKTAGSGYLLHIISASQFYFVRDGVYSALQSLSPAYSDNSDFTLKSTEQGNGDLLIEILVNGVQSWSFTELSVNKLPVGHAQIRATGSASQSLLSMTVEHDSGVEGDLISELSDFDFSATASVLISADLSADLSSFDFSAAATVAYPPGGFLHAELASFDFNAEGVALIQGGFNAELSSIDFNATALLGRQCVFDAEISSLDVLFNAGLGRIASFNPELSDFDFNATASLGRIAAFDAELSLFDFNATAELGRIASFNAEIASFSISMLLGNTFPTEICMAPVGSGSSISPAGGSQFDFTTGGSVKRRAYYDESVELTLLIPAATVLQRQMLDEFHDDNELTKFFIDIPFDRSGSTRAYRVAFKNPPLPVSQVADRCDMKIQLIGTRN